MSEKTLYFLQVINHEDITYDCYDSFMIIATSPEKARQIAQSNGADECHRYCMSGLRSEIPFWTDPKKSSCKVLNIQEQSIGIIQSSFNAG